MYLFYVMYNVFGKRGQDIQFEVDQTRGELEGDMI